MQFISLIEAQLQREMTGCESEINLHLDVTEAVKPPLLSHLQSHFGPSGTFRASLHGWERTYPHLQENCHAITEKQISIFLD